MTTISSRAVVLLSAVAMAAVVLGTATYMVYAPAGSWDLQPTYTAWASTIPFRARDQIGIYCT
jgi:hypothetical protein